MENEGLDWRGTYIYANTVHKVQRKESRSLNKKILLQTRHLENKILAVCLYKVLIYDTTKNWVTPKRRSYFQVISEVFADILDLTV